MIVFYIIAMFIAQASSKYMNATTSRPRATGNVGNVSNCAIDCTREFAGVSTYGWMPSLGAIHTTTLETEMVIVNTKRNTTRTTTITNTEIDLNNITTPTDVDSRGTRTVVTREPALTGTGWVNVTITFPSTRVAYDTGYGFNGTLATSINGTPTCTTAKTDDVYHPFQWPSHPPVPDTLEPPGSSPTINFPIPDPTGSADAKTNGEFAERFKQNPQGWVFEWTIITRNGDRADNDRILNSMFPDEGIWLCNDTAVGVVSPPEFNDVALYLTDTITSTEDDDGPTSMEEQPSSKPPAASPTVTQGPGTALQPVAVQSAEALIAPSPEPSTNQVKPSRPPPPEPALAPTADYLVAPSPEPSLEQDASTPPTPASATPLAASNSAINHLPDSPTENDTPSPPTPESLTDSQYPYLGSLIMGAFGKGATSAASPPADTTPHAPVAPQPQVTPSFTIGSQVIAANSQGQFEIESQKLTPGGVVSVAGTPISLDQQATAVMVGTKVQQLPAQTPSPPQFTVGSEIVTANTQGAFVVGGQTLTKGGIVSVAGTPISLNPQGTQVVVGTNAQELLPPSPIAASPPAFTLGGQSITANQESQYIINDATLTNGGVITVSGTPISLGQQGSEVVVGTNTQKIAQQTLPPSQQFTLGSQVFTANIAGDFIIGDQTLSQGAALTVSGTPISLNPQGSNIVVAGSTQQLSPLTSAPPAQFTLGSQTITANPAGAFILNDQTLTPSGIITLSGTPISLDAQGSNVIIASSTQQLSPQQTSPPAFLFGSQTVTADAQGNFVVAGQTLTKGGEISVSQTPISLDPQGSNVVVASSTQALGRNGTASVGSTSTRGSSSESEMLAATVQGTAGASGGASTGTTQGSGAASVRLSMVTGLFVVGLGVLLAFR